MKFKQGNIVYCKANKNCYIDLIILIQQKKKIFSIYSSHEIYMRIYHMNHYKTSCYDEHKIL